MRIILLLLLLPITAQALNVENAKRINKTCALCHGLYSQGTPGMMSPRLAGLPSGYIAKEMRYYRDGTREYAPMVVTSSIKSMTDEDIQDISEYLGDLDIRQMGLPEIPEHAGDTESGRKIFKRECKSCHGRKGHGKPHKEIPPIAGQYGSYLINQINKFRIKERYHDDDPEDDLFKDFSIADLNNIVAFVTQLPPHRFVDDTTGMLAMAGMGDQTKPEPSRSGIETKEDDSGISGRFRVTPTGEIILEPQFKDIRGIAGLTGKFHITASGEIRFDPENAAAVSARNSM